MGVQLTHDFADHAGALDVALVGAQAHLLHHVEDAALHGLEAVAGVGQGAGVDDRVGVFQETGFHLAGHVDIDDIFDDVGGVVIVRGGAASHRDLFLGIRT